jgi:hypothetical protein
MGEPERTAVGEDTPTTVCSVVWYEGSPWVLHGEPGIPRSQVMRFWVGYRLSSGRVSYMTEKEMAKARPAVIYRDTAGEISELQDK